MISLAVATQPFTLSSVLRVSESKRLYFWLRKKKYLSTATLLLRKDEIKKNRTSVRERCLFKQKTKHSLCDMNGNLGITMIPQFSLYIPVDTDNKVALPLPSKTSIPNISLCLLFLSKKAICLTGKLA